MLVQNRNNLMRRQPLLRRDEIEDGRVYVAGARAHHQAFERRQAHRVVNAVARAYGRRRAAVAEMQRDDVSLLALQPSKFSVAISDVAVRRAVEAEAAYAVASVQLIGQRVEVGVFGE